MLYINSVHTLLSHNTLKVVMRPLNGKHKNISLKDNSTIPINNLMSIS